MLAIGYASPTPWLPAWKLPSHSCIHSSARCCQMLDARCGQGLPPGFWARSFQGREPVRATHGAGARTPCRSSPRCPHRGSLRTSAQLSGAFELEGVLGKDIPGPGSWLGVFFFFFCPQQNSNMLHSLPPFPRTQDFLVRRILVSISVGLYVFQYHGPWSMA